MPAVHAGENLGNALSGDTVEVQVHLAVACREPGCRPVWYDPPDETASTLSRMAGGWPVAAAAPVWRLGA